MEHSTRLAHISEDGTRTQTVYDHLAGTARLAGSFAAPFGAQSEAECSATRFLRNSDRIIEKK